jgi:hypothetical protein
MVSVGPVEGATVEEVTALGRADSVAGRLAVHLAREIDRGEHTGAAQAALAARLLVTMREARAGATRAVDAVDELQARRNRTRGA